MPARASVIDRILSESADGVPPDRDAALALAEAAPLPDLTVAARCVQARRHRRAVTYSRSVFIPLTNICRDRCGYCVFRKDAGEPGAWILTPDDVRRTVAEARSRGCQEVLFSLGDKPEVFPAVREELQRLGHRTMLGYLTAMCRLVVEEFGLFPHTNAGVFGAAPMQALRPWNLSMGLMLESVSERLCGPGGAHDGAPDKLPHLRLRMLETAGKLKVPFTTGVLIGIGETLAERVDTLLAFREMQARYGHIQEIIVQNFRAKPGTPMAGHPEPSDADMLRTVALARLILGPEMNIQAPPNLNPDTLPQLLAAGANDWGGVSPLTLDFINPEMPWPEIERLRRITAAAGFTLHERLPAYPEYLLDKAGFVDEGLLARAQVHLDPAGYVKGDGPACLDSLPIVDSWNTSSAG